jgi:hypothetical protein
MLIDLWVHQVATSYGRSALPADDGALPLREVWEKCCDGLAWMAAFDRHPRAIDGLEAVARRGREHRAAGRTWRPWLVPHGRTPGGPAEVHATAEGRRAAEVGRAGAPPGAAPGAILDVEPHYHGGARPQFWRDDLGAGPETVRALLDAYLAHGGGEVWLCLDAREPHLAPIAFEAWRTHPAVTRFLPQVYWTDFLRGVRAPALEDVRRSLEAATAVLTSRGVPAEDIAPVLPADTTPALLLEGYAHARRLGLARPSLWQRMTLAPATVDALAAARDPWGPTPLEAARRHVVAARAALDAALEALDD